MAACYPGLLLRIELTYLHRTCNHPVRCDCELAASPVCLHPQPAMPVSCCCVRATRAPAAIIVPRMEDAHPVPPLPSVCARGVAGRLASSSVAQKCRTSCRWCEHSSTKPTCCALAGAWPSPFWLPRAWLWGARRLSTHGSRCARRAGGGGRRRVWRMCCRVSSPLVLLLLGRGTARVWFRVGL